MLPEELEWLRYRGHRAGGHPYLGSDAEESLDLVVSVLRALQCKEREGTL